MTKEFVYYAVHMSSESSDEKICISKGREITIHRQNLKDIKSKPCEADKEINDTLIQLIEKPKTINFIINVYQCTTSLNDIYQTYVSLQVSTVTIWD